MSLGFSGSGTVVARARAIIEADTSGVPGALRRTESDFDKSSRTIEGHAGRLRQALDFSSVFLGLEEGFHLVGEGVHAAFDKWKEGEQTAAQTAAVLKSTGSVAGVSAKQVDDYASALERKSGVDKEAIANGENMLLTFKNIRNEAGKGNDIFAQTTKAVLDMDEAMTHGNVTSENLSKTSILVGKALNDPIKGMTALQRVGVTFTNSQKDQIKALVESGHGMDAQKLILRELTSEFGGSAVAVGKTLPGQLSILKQSLTSTGAHIIGDLMPKLTQMTSGVNAILPKLEQWGDVMDRKLGPIASSVFSTIYEHAKVVLPIFANIVEMIAERLQPIFSSLGKIVLATFAAVDRTLEAHRDTINKIVGNLSTILGGIVTLLEHTLVPILKWAFTSVLPVVLGVALKVLEKLTGAIAGIVGFVQKAITSSRAIFLGFWNWLERTAIQVALNVVEPFSHLPGKLGGWARKAKDSMNDELDKLETQATTIGTTAGTNLGSSFMTALTPFVTQAGGTLDSILGGVTATGNANAAKQSGGTAFGLIAKAQSLGPSSGGVYARGGGHGGIAKPGSVLDCSGYVYQVFTQNGFKSFPGTSETQWSTMRGPNWTSEVIPMSDATAGDVVFFDEGVDAMPGHVGVIVGGRGSSASFIEYYATGLPARESHGFGGRKVRGFKRFYLVTKQSAATTPSTSSGPDFTAHTSSDFSTPKATGASASSKAAAAKRKADSAALKAENLNTLRDSVADVEKEIPNLTADMKAKAKPLTTEIANLLAKGIVPTPAQLARAKTDLSKLKKLVQQSITDAKTAVTSSTSSFEQEWSRLADKAMQAFDAATQKGLANVKVSLFGGSFGANDKTPAEAALEQLQAAHDAQQAADDMAAAQAAQSSAATDLQSALASGDADAIASAKSAYDDASKQVADLAYQSKVDELQAKAQAERDQLDSTLSEAQAQYQTQRDLQKQSLQDQLDDLKAKLESGKETYSDYMKDVSAILNDPSYGASIADSGDTLGSMFADAFGSAFDGVRDSVNDMIDALNRYNALVGKPAVGKIGATSSSKTSGLSGAAGFRLLNPIALATGGVAWDPTHAVIGDGGTPEVVVPVSREIAAQLSGSSRGTSRLTPSTRDMLSGAIERAVAGGNASSEDGDRPHVTVIMQTQASPEDPAQWLRSAKFVADHVFGT